MACNPGIGERAKCECDTFLHPSSRHPAVNCAVKYIERYGMCPFRHCIIAGGWSFCCCCGSGDAHAHTHTRAPPPRTRAAQPLAVELGPGILDTIFDGIQRPLKRIAIMSGDCFIPRGVAVSALDDAKMWEFAPTSFKVWCGMAQRPHTRTHTSRHADAIHGGRTHALNTRRIRGVACTMQQPADAPWRCMHARMGGHRFGGRAQVS
jgi:hypothetical protein